MHYRFFRDSFFGRTIYHLSGQTVFVHAEDSPDYVVPEKYTLQDLKQSEAITTTNEVYDSSSQVTPVTTDDGKILVDWDGPNDPENPENWPLLLKIFFIFEIAFLTTSVYMGSAIYTPGIDDIMAEFNVNQTIATLPLTLFVIGYGIGPMVFSPMSENAIFGRTSIYIITLFIFFILQIPTALSTSIAGLCVLRFISGIFASPCLATGAASVCDVLAPEYGPVGIASWALATVCGPSLGPLVGSILVVKRNWRWTFWFLCIVSGCSFLMLGCMLPESYGKTLLLRKAQRLRKVTGNQNITTQDEIDNSKLTVGELAVETLWKPIEITFAEPVVLLINVHLAMVYAVLYLWFEAFPIVFYQVKHFTLIEMGVAYTSIMVGVLIAACCYIPLVKTLYTNKVQRGEEVHPEVFIPTSIVAASLMPVGIFIFGWTASPDIHWIGPLLGATVFASGAWLMFQTLFNYLGMSFWKYLASVFAGNDLFRSVVAGVFPLFGKPLFDNVHSTEKFPVGWGSSILGFITLAMVSIPVLFYINGPKLRARSKYSSSKSVIGRRV